MHKIRYEGGQLYLLDHPDLAADLAFIETDEAKVFEVLTETSFRIRCKDVLDWWQDGCWYLDGYKRTWMPCTPRLFWHAHLWRELQDYKVRFEKGFGISLERHLGWQHSHSSQ